MSLQTQIIALAQAIGTDIKAIRASVGTLSGLSTTAKGNIVASINELYALVAGFDSGAVINDTVGDGNTTNTWSANKIHDTITLSVTALKNELVDGSASALDTLKELSNALNNDPSFATTIANDLSKRVRFDAVQTLTVSEKLQACTNIGIGNPETDFAAAYATAKV